MNFYRRLGVWALLANSLLAGSARAEEPREGGEPSAAPADSAASPSAPEAQGDLPSPQPVVLEPVSPASPSPSQEATSVEIASEEAASEGSSAGRVVGFVAMGVGGAALLTGGVFGVLALRDEARLSARCPRDTCTPDQQSTVDTYESKKLVSGIGLLSGVLLGAGGAALFVLSSSSGSKGAVSGGVYWAGREAGVWGAF